MKQKHKKSEKKKTSKKLITKLSYIGVGMAAGLGVVGVLMTMRFSNVTEHIAYQTPMPLPTAAPVFAQTPAPKEVYRSAPVPTPVAALQEQEVSPVFAEPSPLIIILPVTGDILKPFSMDKLLYERSMGDWRVHGGVDIQAEKGAEVKAAAAGKVEKLYKDALLGYTVILSHEGGYQTLYQNLASAEMLKEGQTVEKGQCIGAVGDSAPAEMLDAAHLHFAMKEGEHFVNPMDFLEKNPA